MRVRVRTRVCASASVCASLPLHLHGDLHKWLPSNAGNCVCCKISANSRFTFGAVRHSKPVVNVCNPKLECTRLHGNFPVESFGCSVLQFVSARVKDSDRATNCSRIPLRWSFLDAASE